MEKFKVIDPKGITVNGVLVEKGETVTLAKGAQLNAFIHFKQVEPSEAKAEDPEADAKKAEAERLEAEKAAAAAEEEAKEKAKAKAEADAKGKK